MTATLRAPFPWFGGKSRAAHLVWPAFGDVANYVEPFAGSLAVLLARPTPPRIETVNDLDCYLANFWRAVAADPQAVARHADWPVNEADLHARHQWLVNQADFRERMKSDPDHFDAKIAGWWVWGLSAWLGSGWCRIREAPPPSGSAPLVGRARNQSGGGVGRQIPFVGNAGRGVHRGGQVSRQIPELYWSKGTHSSAFGGNFDDLCARLRRVRVVCGDWRRVLTDSVTIHVGAQTGVFLDPPYDDGNMSYAAGGQGVSGEVREWALAHGDDPRLRIVLCGYEGEHTMPATWRCVPWKAKGGYSKDQTNSRRERLWLSPHCLGTQAQSLLPGVAA